MLMSACVFGQDSEEAAEEGGAAGEAGASGTVCSTRLKWSEEIQCDQ